MNTLEQDVTSILKKQLRNTYRILNHSDLLKRKEDAYTKGKLVEEVGVVELHPTDRCDLQCFYCTYGTYKKHKQEGELDFPYNKLHTILDLKPKAIVFAGGGEPLLYNSQGKKFEDIVHFFKKNTPNTKLGLITNGVRTPSEACESELEWVRISLDAPDKDTFRTLKGGIFEKRLETILDYVRSPIRNVGIGFLYNRFNFKQILDFIKTIYEVVLREQGVEGLQKVNIQFRATCPIESCGCPSENYEESILMTPDCRDWWNQMAREIVDSINKFDEYENFKQFVCEQTNVMDILKRKESHALCFNHCYTSVLRWTVRSNGDVYPCVIKASNHGASMGNILHNPVKYLFETERRFFELEEAYCSGTEECCRIGGVLNEIVEQNRHVVTQVGTDDPFF